MVSSQSQQNSVIAGICRVMIFGTCFVVSIVALALLASIWLNGNPQAASRLVVCGLAFVYLKILYVLTRRNKYTIVAHLLVLLYILFATGIVLVWGINMPVGLLIFALTIVLSGILLKAKHAIFAALVASLILLGIQTVINLNIYKPETSWSNTQSCYGDIVAYIVVFTMLALVSWLYNREIQRSLTKAQAAEVALLRQKATLEVQVKARTRELRQAQVAEMRQMYHFAELGQLGVTLLHDLANHLTALTLEIEDVQGKQDSKELTRARQITQYLDDMVNDTRDKLNGGVRRRSFDIVRKTNETIDFLHYKAAKTEVTIDWKSPKHSWRYVGDPDNFAQIIAIITNNAIDSYGAASRAGDRRVSVDMERNETHIIIRISDWGGGIPKSERKQLFKPRHSTKKAGLGLGLYIAKQIVEMQFSGSITLNPRTDYTEFIVKLPIEQNG